MQPRGGKPAAASLKPAGDRVACHNPRLAWQSAQNPLVLVAHQVSWHARRQCRSLALLCLSPDKPPGAGRACLLQDRYPDLTIVESIYWSVVTATTIGGACLQVQLALILLHATCSA